MSSDTRMGRAGYIIIAVMLYLGLLATCQKVSRAASVVSSATMGGYTSAMNARFNNQTAHIRRTSPIEGQTITGGPLMITVPQTANETAFQLKNGNNQNLISSDASGNVVVRSTIGTTYNVATIGMQTPTIYARYSDLIVMAGENTTVPSGLLFKTNTGVMPPVEQMRITPTGNVGIGTTTPSSKLDVRGSANITAGNIGFTKIAAPDSAAVTATLNATAGNLTATNVKYRITYVTAIGETSALNYSNSVAAVTAQKVDLSGIPVSADSEVTARKIYRTSADNYYFNYVGTISDNTTTTFTDNAVLELGKGVTWLDDINSTAGQLTGVSSVTLGTNTYTDPASLKIIQGNLNTNPAPIIFSLGTTALMNLGIYDSSGHQELQLSSDSSAPNAYFGVKSTNNLNAGIKFAGAGYRGRYFTDDVYNHYIEPNDQYMNGHLIIKSAPNGTGNVGIGTATPASKLTVAGTIETTTGGVKFPDGTTQSSANFHGGTW